MSSNNLEAAAVDKCCASCGKAEVDDIKLMDCDGCDLVKYCSDECKEGHRPEHEESCKKRVADLREELLFRQPEGSYLGDCPICYLPHSLDLDKSELNTCCSKLICKGCKYADITRGWNGRDFHSLDFTCPFCRCPAPKTQEDMNKIEMKRIAANDPIALRNFGKNLYLKRNYDGAFKYWTKAAELGDADAHYHLSLLYNGGLGVEKDETKKIFHLEEAAIGGFPQARHNLAVYENRHDRFERAVKHWIIAANLGYDDAIEALKECYKDGEISKEDFAAALRGHQAAVDATKSPQREVGV